MTEEIDDAIAALLGKLEKINEEEEEEEEKKEKPIPTEKKVTGNDGKKDTKQPNNEKPEEAIEESNHNENEEIYIVKKIVKIDLDQAKEAKNNEISEQVEITSKEISNNDKDQEKIDDDQGDDIDLDNFEIDWHFHKPSTK